MGEQDEDAAWFRAPWEDLDDDTPLPAWRPVRSTADGPAWLGAVASLLGPLCAAQDALARLDAAAALAPEPVRAGLIARLALREAAGWLAHEVCWVHPLDLALRDANLTGAPELAALAGGGGRALPHTYAAGPAWDRTVQDPDQLPGADQAVGQALVLVRLWRRLASARTWRPLATIASAAAVLDPLGRGPLDLERLAGWHAAFAGTAATDLPPLLRAAWAAEYWMEGGISDPPSASQAVFAASLLLAPRAWLAGGGGAGLGRLPGPGVWRALAGCHGCAAQDLRGRRPGRWPSWRWSPKAPGPAPASWFACAMWPPLGRRSRPQIDPRSRLPDAVDAVLRVAGADLDARWPGSSMWRRRPPPACCAPCWPPAWCAR